MFNQSTHNIIVFTICVAVLLILLCTFIIGSIYRHQQKQHAYYKDLEELKVSHENALLKTQLEVQECTFQNISREIHDNIGQKLSLAKLYLNTIPCSPMSTPLVQVTDSVDIISQAINDLSDIARSMSSEMISNYGLVKCIERQVLQLQKSGIYQVVLSVTGDPVFSNFDDELIVFRIFQESLNNIIKHADATKIDIHLHYDDTQLSFIIEDNGKGFVTEERKNGTGLANIRKRTRLLKGHFSIVTSCNKGTLLNITIPINAN